MKMLALVLLLAGCVGVADDVSTGTNSEELRYSCGIEGGGCYCCYDMDAYTGCCMCPRGGAHCR